MGNQIINDEKNQMNQLFPITKLIKNKLWITGRQHYIWKEKKKDMFIQIYAYATRESSYSCGVTQLLYNKNFTLISINELHIIVQPHITYVLKKIVEYYDPIW